MSAHTDNILKSLYTTIFALKFSHDANELAACDNFGNISIYKFGPLKLLFKFIIYS